MGFSMWMPSAMTTALSLPVIGRKPPVLPVMKSYHGTCTVFPAARPSMQSSSRFQFTQYGDSQSSASGGR